MKTKRLTRKKEHWQEGMCDVRLRANIAGLTLKEAKIARAIYDEIPQYRLASRILASGKIYTRVAPQGGGHGDLDANCGAAYIWKNNELETICHNTSYYRLHQAVRAYNDYTSGKIKTEIWENYITNGYNTRRGLYFNYDEKRTKRIKKIARSHADYMGSETGDSLVDHARRVSLRNNF